MDCFYHPGTPALGVCKHCGRGICMDCLILVDDVLACKDRHEQPVRDHAGLEQRNLMQSQRVSSGYMRNAAFYGLVGAVFAAFGLWQLKWLGLQAVVFVMLGGFLLYAAAANYFEGRRFR